MITGYIQDGYSIYPPLITVLPSYYTDISSPVPWSPLDETAPICSCSLGGHSPAPLQPPSRISPWVVPQHFS